MKFPNIEEFTSIMQESGFISVKVKPLTFGIVNIFHAQKRHENDNNLEKLTTSVNLEKNVMP